MPPITPDEIDETIEGHLSPTNKSPYDRKFIDGGADPYTIYLYCWDIVDETPGQEQKPRGFKLEYDRPILNQVMLIRLINEEAQRLVHSDEEPDGIGFDGFDYRRKSFIVILLTDRHWLFPEGKAIVFDETKGWGNHTFFNAFHPEVSIEENGAERPIPALCFTNWMADAYGRPLHDNQRESFHYILFPVGGVRALMAEIDPGGNNLGPPIAPP